VSARRAAWRFLLPDPELGRVAYLAPHEPELVAALTLVSRGVDLLDSPASDPTHDLVVITGGDPRTAGAARALLRPGGWLYAEMPGRAAGAWARELREAGFDEVGAYWLWPDEHTSLEIVPLEREAVRHALERRDPGARFRLRARAARLLVELGLLNVAVRCAAVIGCAP
jgi:hypothetical protein